MHRIRALVIAAVIAAYGAAQEGASKSSQLGTTSVEAAQALVDKLRHRLTDREFDKVVAATSATELDLSNCKGLAKGALQRLQPMQGLRSLSIADSGKLVHGVQHLAALPLLRVLDASGNKEFTGAGLGALTQLRELNLNKCDAIQDKHLKELHTLRNLETLRLYGCHKIKDPGFNKLFAKLPRLHTLELAFCWWHEGHEIHWPRHLVHLDLHESKRLVDAAIEAIPNKGGLRTLNLFQCLVLTDESMAALRGLSKLQWLDIGSIRALTDAGLADVATLTGLRHLSMCDNANFTGTGLAKLATLTKLEELNLWHCEALTNEGLVACASMPALQRLVLASCRKLGDAGLVHLRELPSLRDLHLDGCLGVTAHGIEQLQALPLRELSLKGCRGIDDRALQWIAAMSSLRYLDLRDCPKVTSAALAALRKALPDCQVRP